MGELIVNEVSKQLGNIQVIDNLSFSIKNEEFVSLLGPSGSGKSTIFHMIGGIMVPDKGRIEVEGSSSLGRRGVISYMPQTPSLLPWRNVLDNVLLGQELHGVQDIEMALDMLRKAGLEGYEHVYPHQLSGGMKQRVAFIRASLSPQSVMCLDEPFSALDELTRQDMQAWLLTMWEKHRRTVLFVTHSIEEAIFLSDRILILSNKPTHIKADIEIPFPRPRLKNLVLTDEFFEWKRRIAALLTD
ncbi:ABC transporter ATP-binding protein [Bacillus sp. HMF5848]|uniref:ABC transporter ATP-binding protein n=1 Tax=Bacillus sp. HMF5848 TaxID=2495421 RepID=UPI000F769182|nr:ABC transporter ATP-binding protein [Bacillus sp. HMF5848]RSK25994.1 ABC transporter ATP-binding protein [Bacillus sp. HMF5848]